jgi:hypothetical protein
VGGCFWLSLVASRYHFPFGQGAFARRDISKSCPLVLDATFLYCRPHSNLQLSVYPTNRRTTTSGLLDPYYIGQELRSRGNGGRAVVWEVGVHTISQELHFGLSTHDLEA